MKSTSVVFALLLAGCSDPAPPPSQCVGFAKAIDVSLRAAAYEIARAATECSAINAAVHEIRISNYLAHVGIQLQLMAQNKCHPIDGPITVDVYAPQAQACFKILGKWRSGDPYPVPACDVKNWVKPDRY